MKVALGQPRRFRLRSVWRGLAIPFVLALVFSACGSRMSHRAVVDATDHASGANPYYAAAEK